MEDIFETYENAADRISHLKQKSITLPSWETLLPLYEPLMHEIVNDTVNIRDRKREDGIIEVASRIPVGLEKLIVSRFVDFTFAIPVRRIYHNVDEDDTNADIVKAIDKIYKYARIDTENIRRARNRYACCEFCTIWYAVPCKHNLYGFESNYKLKCRTLSPMDGVKLFPLFDENEDMVAMSFEYSHKVGSETQTYFETYTKDKHYKWKSLNGAWEEEVTDEKLILGKIPAVYSFRRTPVYFGFEKIRSEIEYTLSRNSNTISYNAAPVLKVAGSIQGEEKRDNPQRIFRVENGGDVQYVSWSQSIEAVKYQIEVLLNLYFMQAQMPDISFQSMKALGNIGYDARQTLFMDAHLKIGEETGDWIEALEREANIIKAFVKLLNASWSKYVDDIEIEHVITPFIQNDEKSEIQKWMTACGGKQVMSQREAIKNLGYSTDIEQTMQEIQEEEAAKMQSVFGGESAM